jgi:hypothetical protein
MEDIMQAPNTPPPNKPESGCFDHLITEDDYARIRQVSVRTCQRDRHLRNSAPFIKVGRRVYYRIEAVKNWLIEHETSGPDTRALRSRVRRTGGRS